MTGGEGIPGSGEVGWLAREPGDVREAPGAGLPRALGGCIEQGEGR